MTTPAFPTANIAAANRGITKREFFAAVAMHSILDPHNLPFQSPAEISATAYRIADAMLDAGQPTNTELS